MSSNIQDKDIHAAINAVMTEVSFVKKIKAEALNYTYAGEASLIGVLRPAMVRHGIYCYVLSLSDVKSEAYQTAKGSQMQRTTLAATVRFVHAPSGTSIDVMSVGEGADSGDKSQNKAMTGAYKYALRQTFCIATGDDPDKFASQQRAAQPKAAERVDVKTGEITSPSAASKPTATAPAKQDPLPIAVIPTTAADLLAYVNKHTGDHYKNLYQVTNALKAQWPDFKPWPAASSELWAMYTAHLIQRAKQPATAGK